MNRAPKYPSRLGRNTTGYAGETIAIADVLTAMVATARRHGWEVEPLLVEPGYEVPALRRSSPASKVNLYLSTGVHGDEPAGPLAVQRLLEVNQWPIEAGLWLVPCLNVRGFHLNRRENPDGVDLNRDYRHQLTPEVRAHIAWLEQQPRFDLCLCIHEDWGASGFYLYEQNPDHRPSLAETITQAVAAVCPIDTSPIIEHRPATNGVIRPNIDPDQRPQWPEAFYLIRNKTRLTYTLEAPSDFPLPMRVAALTSAIQAALAEFSHASGN